jgi:hypothetical protein
VDIPAPGVIQRSPARSEPLAPDGAVELVFDRPMDEGAVAKAFKLQPAGQEEVAVAGDFQWVDERTVRFKPVKALARATTYDVILTQDATADSGEPLRQPYTFRFATAGFLEVAQVIPAPDSADVETDATITVMFNRPVVPLTSLKQMEGLPDPLIFEPAVEGTGEWLNTSIYVFTPSAPLSGGIKYTAKVNAGLQDIAGAVLAEDYVWHFTTVPPKVIWVQPRDGAELVDINTPITVQFNQPIDPASAQQAFTLKAGGLLQGNVEGTFDIQDTTLIFTPTQALNFNTRYQVAVAAGVMSQAGGQGMVAPHTWQFTTVPLPRIVSTYPKHGERNAPPYTEFRITFNTRIDPTTVMPNLTMTPPLSPTLVYTYYSHYNQTFILRFGAQPSTDYTVVIEDGIADPYGNTIPQGRTVNFRTAPLPPSYQLRVPDFIGTYDAAQPTRVVVGHVNVKRINLRLYKLPVDAIQQPYWNWREELPPNSALMREWHKNLESPLNKQMHTAIDLATEGTLEPGLYFLDTDSPDLDPDYGYRYNQSHVLVVSNLNLTMKTGPREVMVWATDLATGQPVPDLALTFMEINGRRLETVQTDADGIARLDLRRYHNTIVAYSESPLAIISSEWMRGIGPWDFGMGEGVHAQDYRAYIYTDRPIYRPDQTVNFKGVVRREDDATFRLADIGQVHVIVRDAAYEEIFNESLSLSELGTFNGSVDVEEGASLGSYVISVEFADQYAEHRFQVAAYRPPEFEITVDVATAEIQHGDDVAATVGASYYFGGPLADAAVEWNVLAERYTFEPPWGGRYSFDDVDDPYTCYRCWWWEPPQPPEPIMSGTGTTDANGELIIDLDGQILSEALKEQAGKIRAQRLIIEATASGPDNQYISGRNTVNVHPGPYYIGLVPQQYVSDAGEESHIDLVTVDWEGTRLPNHNIKVEFYRREWINTFVENEFGGGYWEWETEDTLVDEVEVTTDDLGEAVATFIPPKGGSYHVVAMPANPTSETEHVRSSIFIWVAGEDTVSWRRENHDRITLVSDKTSYQVGETAEILIPAPFEVPYTALVSVEREGILRHEIIYPETNSHIYRLPITEADIPNIYVSVVLVKGRTPEALAEFKMGLLPLDVALGPRTLTLTVEPSVEQAEPGQDVVYTITARQPNGEPAAGAEFSLDVVDKAVLSLRPRSTDILHHLYARRALEVGTASDLTMSVNRYQEELAEDLDLAFDTLESRAAFGLRADEGMADGEVMATQTVEKAVEMEEAAPMEAPAAAANIAPPEGVEIREEFADTALWAPLIVTDERGQATVSMTLPDNLTTWVARGVGLTAETFVGEETADLVATKPLLVRPVAPRFFVVDDRAELAANVSNNTDEDLSVEVGLSAEGIAISTETPPLQTVAIPARSETKVTWDVTVNDVTEAQLIFSAVADDGAGGEYADASKPRLTTGPEGSLLVFRYTTPDIVGTAGQLVEGGARTEAIALPPEFDDRRGHLTVRLDPSLAAGMQDGLRYLEHFEYECTEQTVSRFLPNLLTYHAMQSLGLENPELAERLPGLIEEGLTKLYNQQNPDGGWGWWHDAQNPRSNAHVSGYVVFALLKAQQADVAVSADVLNKGIEYLLTQIKSVREYRNYRHANQQAWLLYVLAEGNAAPQDKLDELYDNREKLSYYARAYLAQALWLGNPDDARLATLLSDLNNAAILSATGAHWEEDNYDWWAMNTDTRSTAIILDTLTKLDPDNAMNPNIVRWLMVARKTGIWETTQETAWALIALTDWMVETGELDANYDYALYLNEEELTTGSAMRETIRESAIKTVPIADLLADTLNALTIARTEGPGRLYYTAHLEVYQPVENVEPADRGLIVQRRYTLADCDELNRANCPEVREVKLGDVIRVDLTIIASHDRYYVVVEDPLPAGGEAIDTGLATTSLLAMDPTLNRQDSRYWWWWRWYSRSELRDEKVVLFADYLPQGTYEYSYTFRATLPGDYHVIPTVAKEFYFPEVFGRSAGRLLTIGK